MMYLFIYIIFSCQIICLTFFFTLDVQSEDMYYYMYLLYVYGYIYMEIYSPTTSEIELLKIKTNKFRI